MTETTMTDTTQKPVSLLSRFKRAKNFICDHKRKLIWGAATAAAFAVFSPWTAVPVSIGVATFCSLIDFSEELPKRCPLSSRRKLPRGQKTKEVVLSFFLSASLCSSSLLLSAAFHQFAERGMATALKTALEQKESWVLKETFPVKKDGEYFTGIITDIEVFTHTSQAKKESRAEEKATAEVHYTGPSFLFKEKIPLTKKEEATRNLPPPAPQP